MQGILLHRRGGLTDVAKRFGKHDVFLLGIAFLLLLAVCAWHAFFSRKDGGSVLVTVDGQLYGRYALDQGQTIRITTDGQTTNVLRIQNGRADMIQADCPDRLCVQQHAICKERETIVCLPNKVVVEVVGGEEADLDSVTGKEMR